MAPIQNTITVRIVLPYCNNNILFLTGSNQAMIGPWRTIHFYIHTLLKFFSHWLARFKVATGILYNDLPFTHSLHFELQVKVDKLIIISS